MALRCFEESVPKKGLDTGAHLIDGELGRDPGAWDLAGIINDCSLRTLLLPSGCVRGWLVLRQKRDDSLFHLTSRRDMLGVIYHPDVK